MQKIKLVILDRDGVINRDLGDYVTCLESFELLPGVAEAIARLKRFGFLVTVATNQAGIERGFYSHETLSGIHHQMVKSIRLAGGDIDRIVYCPSYEDQHPWRKPNAGMLVETLNRLGIESHEALFVGDSLTDLLASEKIGCASALVKTGKGKITVNQLEQPEYQNVAEKTSVFDDLPAAVDWICKGGVCVS